MRAASLDGDVLSGSSKVTGVRSAHSQSRARARGNLSARSDDERAVPHIERCGRELIGRHACVDSSIARMQRAELPRKIDAKNAIRLTAALIELHRLGLHEAACQMLARLRGPIGLVCRLSLGAVMSFVAVVTFMQGRMLIAFCRVTTNLVNRTTEYGMNGENQTRRKIAKPGHRSNAEWLGAGLWTGTYLILFFESPVLGQFDFFREAAKCPIFREKAVKWPRGRRHIPYNPQLGNAMCLELRVLSDDAIGEADRSQSLLGRGRVVRDHDHGAALCTKLREKLKDLRSCLRGQVSGRFIGKNHPRSVGERAR